jgi:hypothetical protein
VLARLFASAEDVGVVEVPPVVRADTCPVEATVPPCVVEADVDGAIVFPVADVEATVPPCVDIVKASVFPVSVVFAVDFTALGFSVDFFSGDPVTFKVATFPFCGEATTLSLPGAVPTTLPLPGVAVLTILTPPDVGPFTPPTVGAGFTPPAGNAPAPFIPPAVGAGFTPFAGDALDPFIPPAVGAGFTPPVVGAFAKSIFGDVPGATDAFAVTDVAGTFAITDGVVPLLSIVSLKTFCGEINTQFFFRHNFFLTRACVCLFFFVVNCSYVLGGLKKSVHNE